MKLFSKILDLDKSILKIIKIGNIFCFFICLVATLLLVTYITHTHTYNLYNFSITLFKTGLMFMVEFIVCGFAMDTIKKQIT